MVRTTLNRPVESIEGIGEKYSRKLHELGIFTVGDLLRKGATRKGREEIAKALGVSPSVVLKWVNKADLFRVKGIGEEYSDLLEAAGVDTVVELAQRNPENLYKKLLEVNEKKKLVRRLPSLKEVKKWVNTAKKLKKVVEH